MSFAAHVPAFFHHVGKVVNLFAKKQVLGIYAAWRVAVMANRQAVFYRADLKLKRKSVRKVVFVVNPNATISAGIDGSSPKMTASFFINAHHLVEQLY